MAEHTITVQPFALTVDGTVENGAIVADLTPSAIASEAGALLAANNLSDLTLATTAQTNLGGTTVGKAVFTAANAAAAQTAIGATATGSALLTAANAAAAATAIGAMTLTAVQTFGPFSLGFQAGGGSPDYVGWRPGFAGTITAVCVVTAVSPDGAVTITPTIAGGATTPATVVVPMTDPVGTVQDVPITAGGAFTADQLIQFVATTGGLGGFVSVIVEYTRS